MKESQLGLRERTRRTIQREIAEAAQRLFVERGYEATTIDDVAAAVGMSPRSVFRYFATKEDIVVGKLGLVAEEMLQALRERPADEPVWESLRRSFDLFVPHVDAPGRRELAAPMQRILFTTPALLASYLAKLHLMGDAAETVLRDRARAAGAPYPADDPAPRALVAGAFGCLLAAQQAWLAGGAERTFAAAIDQAMAVVGPARR
ncbi:TetR/AcrR family transcriptional regulator [Solwaraspora sp. WMMB335]|uniref:TetR/AcrR family transcriptional regulator n=1 Tax=Solwaraspora sp. WMMB335 TaxID=3404118 RepID=UPI003B963EBC